MQKCSKTIIDIITRNQEILQMTQLPVITSGVAVVTPIDRLNSVRYRYVIEFLVAFLYCHVVIWIFLWVYGFLSWE